MSQKPKNTEPNPRRNHNLTILLMITIVLAIVGFIFYNQLIDQSIDSAFAPLVLTFSDDETATPTPTALPTYTPSPSSLDDNASINATPMCFFNWAYNDAPEHDYEVIELALTDAGYEMANVMIGSFGEDEICQVRSEIVSSRFLLMDITPHITIDVDDATFNDPSALGADIRKIVTAIVSIDSVSKIRQIEIDILSPDDAHFWMLKYQDIATALSDEISDDAFYELGLQED